MGKIAQPRNKHVNYIVPLTKLWRLQTDTFQEKCREVGKPYGYSGMNVFYFYLLYLYMNKKGYLYEGYIRAL